MLRKIYLAGAVLSLLSAFTSCKKEESPNSSMKVHIDKVTATSATISFTADAPSNAAGYRIGAVVAEGDPMVDDGSAEAFSEMVEADPGRSDYKITVAGLKPETKYNVRAFVLAGPDSPIVWGEMTSFTTARIVMAVDLGLSVKWGDMNVGATSPEDCGDYFAWGETEPKPLYVWSTYKYCYDRKNYYNYYQTKYCTSPLFGYVDNKTTLEMKDDAATVNCGEEWRTPTVDEWEELQENCTWELTTQGGIKGYKVTGNKSGYTDRSIFLPAAGKQDSDTVRNVGSLCCYWSSSLYQDLPFCALYAIRLEWGLHSPWRALVRDLCPPRHRIVLSSLETRVFRNGACHLG